MKNNKNEVGKKTIVLDTSAFVAGFDPFTITEDQFTVPTVEREIKKKAMAIVRFKTAFNRGRIKVKRPDKLFLDKVKVFANKIGNGFFLSEVDLHILALALELKTRGHNALILTDDYSIQNVATLMGVDFASLATFGIRFCLQWVRYCSACYRKYPADYKSRNCEICGTKLKRKPAKKFFQLKQKRQ